MIMVTGVLIFYKHMLKKKSYPHINGKCFSKENTHDIIWCEFRGSPKLRHKTEQK